MVELVGGKPVRGEEHREHEDDVRVALEGLPEAYEFTLPGWVFHEDDARAVATDDVFGIGQSESGGSTQSGEDDESDVSAVSDGHVASDTDVFAERDLRRKGQSGCTWPACDE